MAFRRTIRGWAKAAGRKSGHGIAKCLRFSFDKKIGDLWAGDVGQNDWEEVDLIVKRATTAGAREKRSTPIRRCSPQKKTPSGAIDPIVEYPHRKREGAKGPRLSITGGFVYRGKKVPITGRMVSLRRLQQRTHLGLKYQDGKLITNQLLLKQDCNPSSFGEDKDGELYLCEYSRGIIWKIAAD